MWSLPSAVDAGHTDRFQAPNNFTLSDSSFTVSTTPEAVLTQLDDPLTATQLNQDNDSYLNPAQTPVTVTGSIDTSEVAAYMTGSPATDVFSNTTNNAIITGTTEAVTVGDNEVVPTNILWATSGDNLVIDLLGTTDQITVMNWFGTNAGAQVEKHPRRRLDPRHAGGADGAGDGELRRE